MTENLDLDEYFLSFELTLFVVNYVENALNSKYKNVDRVDVTIKIIENLFNKKLNNEKLNEQQKTKITQDIDTIYKDKLYTIVPTYYLCMVNFFFFINK